MSLNNDPKLSWGSKIANNRPLLLALSISKKDSEIRYKEYYKVPQIYENKLNKNDLFLEKAKCIGAYYTIKEGLYFLKLERYTTP